MRELLRGHFIADESPKVSPVHIGVGCVNVNKTCRVSLPRKLYRAKLDPSWFLDLLFEDELDRGRRQQDGSATSRAKVGRFPENR